MDHKSRGFSLIELLIVVVIIGIVAAISIPNLLAARRSANEGSAVATTRKVSNAQLMFYSTLGNSNFASGPQLFAQQLIGPRTAAALNINVGGKPPTNMARDGYRFRIQTTPASPSTGQQATYVFSAIPATTTGPTQTGTRRFCVNESAVMKAMTNTLGTHFNYNQCTSATVFKP
ncbi:MAG TPA: prepilin-type N-terminal cleavage/methylation domain-containing protein [Pyrinomonadaceae bacterium]|nr:prepilin-type N-terminal cleavage/methylation domain-containing protein [Pyrinomonadaceae bacterium]